MRKSFLAISLAAIGVGTLVSGVAMAAVSTDAGFSNSATFERGRQPQPGDDRGGGRQPQPGDDRGGRNHETPVGKIILGKHGADDAADGCDDHGADNCAKSAARMIVARRGADDRPGDDRGGQRPRGTRTEPGDDRGAGR
jgi:hypothetical protein